METGFDPLFQMRIRGLTLGSIIISSFPVPVDTGMVENLKSQCLRTITASVYYSDIETLPIANVAKTWVKERKCETDFVGLVGVE